MSLPTAEAIYSDFRKLSTAERTKFYALLGESAMCEENLSYEEVFGHLEDDEFTSVEAAEFLEVSMSTFRRYVRDGKVKASGEVSRNLFFAAQALKEFKKAEGGIYSLCTRATPIR